MNEWLVFGVAVSLWLTSTVDLAILWVLLVQLSAIPATGVEIAAVGLTVLGIIRRFISEFRREEDGTK